MTQSYRALKAKNLRIARAWSQEQLAQMAGLDVRTIQRTEKGEPISVESLKALASVFKISVGELTTADPQKRQDETSGTGAPVGDFLVRVSDGNQLFAMLGGVHAYFFNNDSLDSDEDTDLVAGFLQDLHDWSEIWDEVEPGERVHTAHEYSKRIKELEDKGLWIFADRSKRKVAAGERPITWVVLAIHVLKSTNPAIRKFDMSKASASV